MRVWHMLMRLALLILLDLDDFEFGGKVTHLMTGKSGVLSHLACLPSVWVSACEPLGNTARAYAKVVYSELIVPG